MRPNLIQTYMNNMPQIPPEKKDKNLDINHVLSNRTFIKPLPAEGKLVNKNILAIPLDMAKDFKYNIRAIKHAIKGQANDHELGKINDFAMKLGGLAIATYLITKKQTPLKKAMELVGLATFFGAMSIWPKIAINLPTRLIHGFNPGKEYQDSFDRQKPFFQDPMYIPWDLVDDKKIHKIGDKMNIPRDIPNRKEFIQEKMRKIAVQDNTLWMLTAGFATPILSALACNVCEKPLNRFLNKQTEKKAENLLGNISENYINYKDSSDKKIIEFLNHNKDKKITPELIKQIKQILTENFDEVTLQALEQDLDIFLGNTDKRFILDDTTIEKVIKNINEDAKEFLNEECLPNKEILTKSLEHFTNRELNEGELKQVHHIIFTQTKKHLKNNNIDNSVIHSVINKLINDTQSVEKTLYSSTASILDNNKIEILKSVGETLSTFKAKNALLDDYILMKVGSSPETVIANEWNEIVSELPKMFNFSDKEVTSVRHDRKLAGELLRDKLEQITSNTEEYNKVFESLTIKISKLEEQISKLENPKDVKGSYNNVVETVFEATSNNLKSFGFNNTSYSITGQNGAFEGSLKHIQLSYPQNRLLGVRSSLYRLLNTLDLYRRISTMQNIDALHPGMKKEVKEEIVEFVKQLSIEGSTSDYMTKFFALRNPNPSDKLGEINVENGKLIREFFTENKIEIPNDKMFYTEVMKLMYENQSHPDSEKILSEHLLNNNFKKYKKEFIDIIGKDEYFARPYHKFAGYSTGTSYTKFLKVGMAPDKMLHETIKELFNTRQWLKTFGKFGAGLLGFTVLAQFFFGKMKLPERTQND